MVAPSVLTLLANKDKIRCDEACWQEGQVIGSSASLAGRSVSKTRWHEVQKYS
jgi:hypothetical protein